MVKFDKKKIYKNLQIVEEFIAQIFETLKIQIWVKTQSKQPLKWVDIYLKYIFIS
jgi:hypothetical protein